MATTIQIGQILGNYKVLRELGAGGMGVVFEAVHIKLEQQRAALKTLISKLRDEPMVVKRFRNEAHILSRLNHPAVVKVYDIGDLEDGSPYYVMEFVEGASLDGHIAAAQRRPEGCLGIEFLPPIVNLASALAQAHEKGIIHRDLKPGNIMVVADSMSPVGLGTKLLDFGIAKIAEDAQTRTGSHLGTPLYMAPEQIQAPARVGGRADVYALGVILFEILSGQLPFENREPMAVMAQKLYEQPRLLSLFAPKLPPELLRLTMRMLEREPAARPDMGEVEVELRLIAGMPLPRQTGSHNIPDSPDPTIDVKPAVIQAAQVPALTPQKINGELSPRPNAPAKLQPNAPASISDVPSVPVQMPPYYTSPEEPTPKRAPSPLPIADRVPSKANTQSEWPNPPSLVAELPAPAPAPAPKVKTLFDWRRLRPLYLMGAATLLSAAAVVVVLRLPQHEPAPTRIANAAPMTSALVAPPAPTAPPPPTASAAPNDPKGAATLDSKESGQKVSSASAQPAARSSEPQFPTESCIITDMLKPQRGRLIALMRSNGIKLPPGEHLIFDGIPEYPKITTAPSSLNIESTPVYKLLGHLADTDLPSHVELRCRAK